MRNELFKGKDTKGTKIVTWIIFAFLGLSVIINCTAYITGASSVLESWFNLPNWLSMLIYYAFAGFVVMFGMKVVGVSEKISSYVLIGVILLFGIVMMIAPSAGSLTTITKDKEAYKVILGLFSIVSFAMSAVMSVPTIVKGLDGDKNKIRWSIILSELINAVLITIITLSAVIGAGAENLSDNRPASVDLGDYLDSVMSSKTLGRSVQIFGYVFSLFAYSTSLWANTLNLRDIISEQTKLDKKICWIISSLPSLIIAIIIGVLGATTLSKLSTVAGGIQILTSTAIVISFIISRKKEKLKPEFLVSDTITGFFGKDVFGYIVIFASLLATIGSIVY